MNPDEPQPNSETDLEQTHALNQNDAEASWNEPTIGVNENSKDAEPSVQQIGGFQLLEKIGEGGMGVVYKALQPSLRRVVALKTMRVSSSLDEEQIRRFVAEAESLATLSHPGIVRIYDVVETNGVHFFTMEFIDGESLSDRIRRNPLNPADAARIVGSVAEIIQFAHNGGVIHRDIKPGNILLDQNGDPHVGDFGLAKQIDSSRDLTVTGQILGTPGFMAPEQALGKNSVDRSADIYGLGAVLFICLTGRAPFAAPTPIETLRQVIDDEPPSLRMFNGRLPRDLDTICRKCLEKSVNNRFGSAQELADELARFQNGLPIRSRPILRLERSWRWCKRNWQLAAAILVIALTLVAGSTVSTIFGINASHAAAEKEKALEEEELQRKRAEKQTELANAKSKELSRKYFFSGLTNAWESMKRQEPALTKKRLERLVPADGETDYRELVWHSLWEQLHGYEWQTPLSSRSIQSIGTSRNIAHYNLDREVVKLVDLETRKTIGEFNTEFPIVELAIHKDGANAAAMMQPNMVALFSLSDPQERGVYSLPVKLHDPTLGRNSQIRFGDTRKDVLVSHSPKQPGDRVPHEITKFELIGTQCQVIKSWPADHFRFDILDNRLVYLAPTADAGYSELTVFDMETELKTRIRIPFQQPRFTPVSLIWIGTDRVAVAIGRMLQVFQISENGIAKIAESEFQSQVWDVQYGKRANLLFVKIGNGCLQVVSPVTAKIHGFISVADSSVYDFCLADSGLSVIVANGQQLRKWSVLPWAEQARFDHVRESALGTVAWKRTSGWPLYGGSTNVYWLPKGGSHQVKKWKLSRRILDLELVDDRPQALVVTTSNGLLDTNLELLDLDRGEPLQIFDDAACNVNQIDVLGNLVLATNRSYPNHFVGAPTGPLLLLDLNTEKTIWQRASSCEIARFIENGSKIAMIDRINGLGDTNLKILDSKSGNVLWNRKSTSNGDRAISLGSNSNSPNFVVGTNESAMVFDPASDVPLFVVPSDQGVTATEVLGECIFTIEYRGSFRYTNYLTGDSAFVGKVTRMGERQEEIHLASDLHSVRVEPSGLELGNSKVRTSIGKALLENDEPPVAIKPLERFSSDWALHTLCEELLEEFRRKIDSADLDTVTKLDATRSTHRRLKRLIVGRELEPVAIRSYAQFCFWRADYLSSLSSIDAGELLSVAEHPYAAYECAHDAWRAVAKNLKTNNRVDLVMAAGALNNLGMQKLKGKEYLDAIPHLQQAISLQQRVLNKFPKDKRSRQFMVNHYKNLIKATEKSGRHAKLFSLIESLLDVSSADDSVFASLKGVTAALDSTEGLKATDRVRKQDEYFARLPAILKKLPLGVLELQAHPFFEKSKTMFGTRFEKILLQSIEGNEGRGE